MECVCCGDDLEGEELTRSHQVCDECLPGFKDETQPKVEIGTKVRIFTTDRYFPRVEFAEGLVEYEGIVVGFAFNGCADISIPILEPLGVAPLKGVPFCKNPKEPENRTWTWAESPEEG